MDFTNTFGDFLASYSEFFLCACAELPSAHSIGAGPWRSDRGPGPALWANHWRVAECHLWQRRGDDPVHSGSHEGLVHGRGHIPDWVDPLKLAARAGYVVTIAVCRSPGMSWSELDSWEMDLLAACCMCGRTVNAQLGLKLSAQKPLCSLWRMLCWAAVCMVWQS